MKLEEKTVKSNLVYSGRIVKVRIDEVILPDGSRSKREVVEHPGAVAVVPVNGKGEVICVRQFRKSAEKVLLEIPAGKLEEGELPEVCAQRELAEETGYRSRAMKKLVSFYPSPGFSSEVIHVFLAQGLEKEMVPKTPGEFIKVETFPLEESISRIKEGVIEDGKTIVGLLMALEYFKRS